jgi:hypothetical protein
VTAAEILARAGVTREQLGRRLRQLWIEDRLRLRGPIPPSHVAAWETLSTDDQEVDMAMAEDAFAAGWRACETAIAARALATDFRPCHCLCAVTHPAEPDICDALNARIERHLRLRTAVLTVQMCRPCADAADRYQAELHAPRQQEARS